MASHNVKSFIIGAPQSGSGKTTISIGIMAALRNRGYRVQPFKIGPDYIDPVFHHRAAARPSYNLDTWMMGSEGVKRTFFQHIENAHIGVVEGVMGFFDGKGGSFTDIPGLYPGSTAHCAFILNLPVVLVIDARAMAHSAGALVYGFTHYIKELKFAAIIFNKAAGEKHYKMLKESSEVHCQVPVIGYIPRQKEISIPERHLGLSNPQEHKQNTHLYSCIAQMIEDHIDIDTLLSQTSYEVPSVSVKTKNTACHVRIAVACDEAFWFYYEENLDILKDEGAEIVLFSPLNDKKLPSSVDAFYIGGGYPELYTQKLSSNTELLISLKEYADKGGYIYAECGGFMLLTQELKDLNNNTYKMAGVFKTKTGMTRGRHHLGYREIVLKEDTVLGKKGANLRGHEFHYSQIEYEPENSQKIYTTDSAAQGYRFKNTFASYIHIHFASNPSIGESFVNFISKRFYLK
jgi:cobyrinic acid a,c-diamide synthase